MAQTHPTPLTAQNILELRNISKRYDDEAGKLQALSNVSLAIKAGDFVAIMGPSGSGKSTLMNIIGLLDLPSSGEYLLHGQDISQASERRLAYLRRDTIGFVFQAFNLLPRFSVLENVQLPLMYKGIRSSARRERARQVLNSVGLDSKLKNKPSQLSGGQVQRAAIARALINQPSIILADEPTGNLDSKTSKEIMDLLSELNKKGTTIVVVTHDPDVAAYARKVVRILDGRATERET